MQNKYWLISDEDVEKIKKEVEPIVLSVVDNQCRKHVLKAFYILETGLHKTKRVPADFKENNEQRS